MKNTGFLKRKYSRLLLELKIELFRLLYGKPEHIVTWGKGPGDNLLMTPGIYRYYRLNKKKVWVISFFPELFRSNRSVVVFRNSGMEEYVFKKKGYKVYLPYYLSPEATASPHSDQHITRQIARHFKVNLADDELSPVYYTRRSELYRKRTQRPLVVIQSTSMNGHFPMENKQWYANRFEEVVSALKDKVEFIQIGLPNDDRIEGVASDLRGRTSVRGAIGVIASADLFVGLIGFYMHAAKAVNTKSLIIYGGREHPSQSGYADNINIFTSLPCSPCWKWNECDYNRKCMDVIRPSEVIGVIKNHFSLD